MKERSGSSAGPLHVTTGAASSVEDDDKKRRRRMSPTVRFLAIVSVIGLLAAIVVLTTKKKRKQRIIQARTNGVPDCPSSPWKEEENMVGTCPGGSGIQPYPDATTLDDCAISCCTSDHCITWQFRDDTGCLHGGDVRIGMEKDGVSAWCSDSVPLRWQGQFVTDRSKDCSTATWSPHQKEGQCFGLGDKKGDEAGASAEACMQACCANEHCGAWQWSQQAGCFYGKGMHGCQNTEDNPHIFEPFTGRRKKVETRTYTDQHGKPWKQQLPVARW